MPATADGYRLTAPINVTGAVTLVGDGCEMQVGDLGNTQTRGRGSWFFIDHSGIGFLINDPTQYRSGVIIERIGTYRTQPDTTGASFTPAAHDFDFQVKRCDALLRDVSIYNPTKGILHNTGGYGRLSIERLRGQPLSVGVEIDDSADTLRIRDVHFWPFYSNAAAVRTYMLANAKAIVLKDVDNPDLFGILTLGYSCSLSCEPNTGTNAMPVKVRLSNFDFDNGAYGIRIASGGANGVSMLVSHGYILGASSASGSHNVSIETDGCYVMMDNVALDLPQKSNINAAAANCMLRIGNLTLGRWGFGDGTSQGIVASATSQVYLDKMPAISSAGTPAIFGSGALIQCPMLSGNASGTTNASGFLTVAHGCGISPRMVVATVTGSSGYFCTATNYNATTFQLRFSSSAGVAASVAVSADWKAFY